jgi:aminoglycoside 3-N-acetyltransferase
MTSALQIDGIVHAFRQCGIRSGDLLMLHSDSMVLAQLPPMTTEGRCKVFFDALDEVLGPEGTLVLPTFTYSFTKKQNFNVRESASTVGLLSNYFRTLPGVVRSRDPNFSIAARGRLSQELTSVTSNDCFGPDSVFALLEKYDARLAAMGCSIDRLTFVHYVEQKAKVNYRYFKTFSGIIESDNLEEFAEIRYFVRDVERQTELNLSKLRDLLIKKHQLNIVPIGRIALSVVSCGDFLHSAMSMLAENQSALIVEGNPK